MYPIGHHEIAKARVGDLHKQAHRDAVARAARPARRVRKHQAGRLGPALPTVVARRILAVLNARGT